MGIATKVLGCVAIFLLGALVWAGISALAGTTLNSAKEEPTPVPASTPVVVAQVVSATATPLAVPSTATPGSMPATAGTPVVIGPGAAPTSTPVIVNVVVNPIVSAVGTPLPINGDAVLWATSTPAVSAPVATPQTAPVEVVVMPTERPSTGERTAAGERGTSAERGAPGGRDPWVLLPQPEPGSRVAAGRVLLEARARGDAPISQIQLTLDGVALSVALDQRSEETWRGQAAATITPGRHVVNAIVVDAVGRSGSHRWSFEATP